MSKKAIASICLFSLVLHCSPAKSLSLGPEEFDASRKMACVLAQQSLGRLTEEEYGELTHSLLDGFDEEERDNVLAQAVGYYGGLTFTVEGDSNSKLVNLKLEDFLGSATCTGDFRQVVYLL